MGAQYLYYWIDDRGRIVELRVTRRGEDADGASGGRFGRSMTRDLAGSYLRLDDLPSTYAEPVREHMERTGEQQGIVEIRAGGGTASGGDPGTGSTGEPSSTEDVR